MQIYCLKIHNKCLRHLVLINLRNDHLCIYRSWYRIYRFNEFTYLAIFGQTVICFYIKEEKHTCYILCWFRANFQILNGEQTMTPPPPSPSAHMYPLPIKKIQGNLCSYLHLHGIIPVFLLPIHSDTASIHIKMFVHIIFCYMWKLQIEESCFIINSWLKDSTYRIIEKLNDTIKWVSLCINNLKPTYIIFVLKSNDIKKMLSYFNLFVFCPNSTFISRISLLRIFF